MACDPAALARDTAYLAEAGYSLLSLRGLDLFPNQSSGVLTSAAWADGLVDNPAGTTIAHGDVVNYLPLADWL